MGLINFLFGNKGDVTVDNTTYNANSVEIRNGKVIVDGIVQSQSIGHVVNINVVGDTQNVQSTSGKISITGSAVDVSSTSGSVKCGDVTGNVKTVSGDVNCGSIGGNVKTVSGSIRGV